jgi:hypothetical protein
MSNNMKVIMERWDRFVLFENETLEKIKDSEAETKNLIQQISKVQDKQQLQNFLNIVSQDEEIMDLISSFKKMKEIAEKEKVDEGLVDDLLGLQAKAYVEATRFFDSELGKKIATYGPAVAAIALLAYGVQDAGGVEPDMIKDATEMLIKGKKLKAMDMLDYVADVDTLGMVEEQL